MDLLKAWALGNNCGKQGKINALFSKEMKQAKREEISAYLNVLHLINALLSVNVVEIKAKNDVDTLINISENIDNLVYSYVSLMYVDVKIRDKSVVTMVDTCTTYTFMA